MHPRHPRAWKSVLLCTALGLAACDSLKSDPDPLPPPVDDRQPPPPELRVTVTTEGPALCREGTWTLAVSVEGGTPAQVELIHSAPYPRDVPLDIPYRYTLDCATASEGSHSFVARATLKGKRFESPSASVVVDRTGPKVTSSRPEPHFPDVDAPLELVFSEPILRESLQAAPTLLRDGNGFSVAHQAVLSEDGRVLRLVPTAPLRPPITLHVELAQRNMTDLAGNPLDAERDVGFTKQLEYWPFAQTGTQLSEKFISWLSFALADFPQRPVVALVERDNYDSSDKGELVVQRMTGDTWERLPAPRPMEARSNAPMDPRLEAYGAQLVLAWLEPSSHDSSRDQLHVSRYDGTSWKPLGAPLATGSSYTRFEMVLDPTGTPLLVYEEGDMDLRVVRWNGDVWEPLGGALSGNPASWTPAEHPAIAVDISRVVVAWSERPTDVEVPHVFVMEFRDGGWRQVGPPLHGLSPGWGTKQVAIALKGYADSPILAWTEHAYDSDDGLVFSAYWKSGVLEGSASWTHPEELQGATLFHDLGRLRLVMDSTQEPWVVWNRREGNRSYFTYYRKRRSTGWEPEQLVVGTAAFGFRLDDKSFPWVMVAFPQDAILRPQ